MPPFYAEGVRFECQMSGQCCTSRGEYGYVYLNDSDQARLAETLDISIPRLRKKYCDITDGWVHLKGPDKDCSFADGPKCGIYEGRPTQCRTWPFWPENMDAKAWRRDVASFCPGAGQGRLYSADEIRTILKQHEES